ncbi:hypothetical protein GWK85_00380 [Staphylococcus schleiferi subsp. coagulans]|nr:hypothetical protein [Staphylococcus coagulans]
MKNERPLKIERTIFKDMESRVFDNNKKAKTLQRLSFQEYTKQNVIGDGLQGVSRGTFISLLLSLYY